MAGATEERAGSVLRPLRESDVDDVVSIYKAAWGEARPMDREELLSWIRNPAIQPEALRVLEVEGSIVGYGDIAVEDDAVALEVAAPERWEVFLEWAEEVARREKRNLVRVVSYAGDALAAVAASRGYELWRSNYKMRIDFGDAPPDDSVFASSIDVRSYVEVNESALRSAMDESFALDPFFHPATEAHFREFYLRARGFDPSLWLLAWEGDELVGFVLAYPEYIGETVGYVHSLGVRSGWRGQGLGEALLRRAFWKLHEQGLGACVLGVDASNETGAVRLYERVGMRSVSESQNWMLRGEREPR